ncbi:hypothetical protein Ae356Ps1_4226 [Pseudonocardia sp. Ae356_Ps1]|nr:hypothetical protein Ae150APs1_2628 [Pseudonocardia sp. Ae150A_Ps1]OLL94329.1 hypothetical protein Ae356Ps1_4226 [Pseudonocardia sp. Ae356_Ps1]
MGRPRVGVPGTVASSRGRDRVTTCPDTRCA